MRFLFFFITFFCAHFVSAQVVVSGAIFDQSDNSPLTGVGVMLLSAKDSSFVKGTATDENGKFTMSS